MSAVEQQIRDAVKAALAATGTSQSDLARQLGMTRQHVSQVLLGHRRMTFDLAEKMTWALAIPFTVTVGGTR